MFGQNFYQILGVDQFADAAKIRHQYRLAAKAFHPDHFPANSFRAARAEAKFKQAKEAYETLSNPDRRAEYDETLKTSWLHNFARNDIKQAPPTGKSPRDHEPAQGAPLSNKHISVSAPLSLAIQGGQLFVRSVAYSDCRKCRAGNFFMSTNRCPRCGAADSCTPKDASFTLQLPAGVLDGQTFIAHNMGDRDGLRPRGHAEVKVYVSVPDGWIVDGLDIFGDLTISVGTAVLGGPTRISLPTGKCLDVNLPERTEPGRKIRLAAQGLFDGATGERGAVILTAKLALPPKGVRLSREEKAVLMKL